MLRVNPALGRGKEQETLTARCFLFRGHCQTWLLAQEVSVMCLKAQMCAVGSIPGFYTVVRTRGAARSWLDADEDLKACCSGNEDKHTRLVFQIVCGFSTPSHSFIHTNVS